MTDQKRLSLVDDEHEEVEAESSPHLVAFVDEILEEHLLTIPPAELEELTAEDKEAWRNAALAILEDGFTAQVESAIEQLDPLYDEDADDASADDDDNEENDGDD